MSSTVSFAASSFTSAHSTFAPSRANRIAATLIVAVILNGCCGRSCLQPCKAPRIENGERGCACLSEREFPQEPRALGCGTGQESRIVAGKDEARAHLDIRSEER